MMHEKAFELYKEHTERNKQEPEVMRYFGIFNNDWDTVQEVLEDEGIEYED